MKNIKLILLIGIVLLSKLTFAQFDTNYVHLTKDRFVFTPIFEFYKTSIRVFEENETILNKSKVRKFSTQNNLYLGFGLSFYRFGFSLSFLLPHSNINGLEKTSSFSFVGGYTLKKLYGELRMRKYKGFQEEITTHKGDSSSIKRNNEYTQIGGALYYFTANKFNYDAIFKNFNVQKKSAISPFLFTNINHYTINAEIGKNDSTYYDTQIQTAKIVSVKLGGGPSAILVRHNFFIGALANVGASIKNKKISKEILQTSVNSLYPYFELKASLGYNSRNIIASFTYSYDNDYMNLNSTRIGINNYYMQFKIGYKFDSKYLGKAAKFL